MLLDPDVLTNFHPVSNLTYLSKIIKRVVVVRFNQHHIQNGLHEVLQSAYKQNHSTETALLKAKMIIFWQSTHIGSRSHPVWFICIIWYYRPYYTDAMSAWVGNQRCPSLCWWHTAVHGLQAKQCGIVTPNHQWHPKLCHWHQVLDDG